jgi:hypothetical protein
MQLINKRNNCGTHKVESHTASVYSLILIRGPISERGTKTYYIATFRTPVEWSMVTDEIMYIPYTLRSNSTLYSPFLLLLINKVNDSDQQLYTARSFMFPLLSPLASSGLKFTL